MSRNPPDPRATSADGTARDGQRGGRDGSVEPLQSLDWSELDQTTDWPMNFIVRPDQPGPRPPEGVVLPVLTIPADASDDDEWPDSHALTEPAELFAPTVFGPKLRHVDDDDALHADPDSAPLSLRRRRSAFANWSFLWLVLLLLLGLAAAAWIGLPGLRQGD